MTKAVGLCALKGAKRRRSAPETYRPAAIAYLDAALLPCAVSDALCALVV